VPYLITGAAGFIGSHVAERLVSLGLEVVGVDNFDPFYPEEIKKRNLASLIHKKNFKFVKIDLRNFSATAAFLSDVRPSHIIHLAAKAGVRPSFQDPVGYMEANISATTQLLKWAAENTVTRFLLASSSSIYGNEANIPFQESEKNINPISPYGASKLACEKIARVYADSFLLPVVNLRFFTVYGPRQRPDLAIHKFIKAICEEQEIEVFGDGSTSRDYTFISDIVDGVCSALVSPLDFQIESFKTFNLGSHRPVQLKDLIHAIEEVTGKMAKIKYSSAQMGDVTQTYADLSKANKELSYFPKTSLSEGLEQFWSWYQKEMFKKIPPPPPNRSLGPSSRA